MESAITVKGQATIPKAIREHLGLKPGDRLSSFFTRMAAWFCCRKSQCGPYGVWFGPGVGGPYPSIK